MPKHNRAFFWMVLPIVAILILCAEDRDATSVSNQIVVTAMGIDHIGEEVLLSVQAVDALKTSASLSEQSEPATGLYQTKARSVSAALQDFLNESGRNTYILHNKLIALSERAVKDGSLYDTLDFFLRNAECHALVDVVICRDDVQSLLTIHSANDAIEAEYVARMLREGARLGMVVSSRLLDIQQTFGGEYDVAIPILRVENDTPRLDGTMLFRGGYAAGELTVDETTALLYAADAIRTCMHTVKGVTFRVSSVSTTLSFEQDGRCLVSVRGKADVRESRQGLTEHAKDTALDELETVLSNRIHDVLEKITHEYETDPLALVRQASGVDRAFQLANARFSVSVDMHQTERSLLK